MLVAVPTGIKIFNWLMTMNGGSLVYRTHTLWALGFLVTFTLGGISGMFFPSMAMDLHFHESYFVVAHFHYVMSLGSVFAIFAGIYFYFGKMTGRHYPEWAAKLHFWMMFIGANLTFFPQHFIGLAGMPRRYPDYALQFADWNMVSSVGAFLFGFSQLLFLFIVIKCIRGGKQATDEVWDGAEGLEWTVESPAPYHTFSTPPALPERSLA